MVARKRKKKRRVGDLHGRFNIASKCHNGMLAAHPIVFFSGAHISVFS